ncbi:MAG: hypothetical protein AB1642_02660 [Pseudomonadota bacterium]
MPIQAASAVALPYCRHAAGQPVVQQAGPQPQAAAGTHCHEHHAAPDGSAMPDNAAATDDGCDNCDMCHLASTGYLPSASASLTPVPVSIQVAAPTAVLLGRVDTPPQQPPRRLN